MPYQYANGTSKKEIKELNNKIVLSLDIDGLLSFLLLKKINQDVEIYGEYQNLSTLRLVDDATDLFFLDHDVSTYPSMGHHIELKDLTDDSKFYNLNLDYKPFVESQNFRIKCPFSTVILEMIYYKEVKDYVKHLVETDNIKTLTWLLYADNFTSIYQNYHENAVSWLKYYDLGFLSDYIEKNHERLYNFAAVIADNLKDIYGFKEKNRRNINNGFQYFVQEVPEESREKLTKYLCSILDIKEHIKFPKFNYVKNMEIGVFDISDKNVYEELKHQKDNIFSHALIYGNEVSVTFKNGVPPSLFYKKIKREKHL